MLKDLMEIVNTIGKEMRNSIEIKKILKRTDENIRSK